MDLEKAREILKNKIAFTKEYFKLYDKEEISAYETAISCIEKMIAMEKMLSGFPKKKNCNEYYDLAIDLCLAWWNKTISRKKVLWLLKRDETVDFEPPYKCLPIGDERWFEIKADAIIKFVTNW